MFIFNNNQTLTSFIVFISYFLDTYSALHSECVCVCVCKGVWGGRG